MTSSPTVAKVNLEKVFGGQLGKFEKIKNSKKHYKKLRKFEENIMEKLNEHL